jgi:cytochrome c
MKQTLLIAAMLVVSTLAALPAYAGDGAALYKEKTCWSCHGKDAKKTLAPNFPKLAGQNAAYAEQQMKDIKSGARSNGQTAAMKGVMGLVEEQDMKDIADYLSKLK